MSTLEEERNADPGGAEGIETIDQVALYQMPSIYPCLSKEKKSRGRALLGILAYGTFLSLQKAIETMKADDDELEKEVAKLRKDGNQLIDLLERYFWYCEDPEDDLSPIMGLRPIVEGMDAICAKMESSDPMKDVPSQRRCGTLNQDYWDMKQKVAALRPATPVSSMMKTGLFAIVCMLAIAAIYLVPPIANFFTGNIYMTVLTIAAVILLIVLWRKNGFCLGYLMLLGIGLAVGIPLGLLEQWLGAAATEQLLFALILGAVAFFCIISIWADIRNNKTEPRLAAEYVHHLYTMLCYSEACYEHAQNLGLGELAAYYNECTKDICQLFSQLETKFPELAKSGDGA